MRIAPLLASVVFAFRMPAAPVAPRVTAAMQAQVEAREIAGAVTLVATRDKVVHLAATGLADVEKNTPMTTDAFFWIASTSKPFVGIAVLMCQDDGKLKVTDPVAKYLPEFAELKTPSNKPTNLTIEQLLTHTSGLADLRSEDYLGSKDLAGMIPKLLARPMQFEPGARWKYATAAFAVAARIVEIVSGKPYDIFLQERLLDPLGMKDTTFYPTDAQWQRLASTYAKNRTSGALEKQRGQIGHPVRGQFPPVPGGGLFSTASDLGQLGRMLLNRGTLDGRRYLSDAAWIALSTARTGDLPTGFSAAHVDHVLAWGRGVYVLREPHAGVSAALSPGAFGHPGACGTHLIVDPVKGLAYVLMIQRPNLPDNFDNPTCAAFVQAAAAEFAAAR